MDTTKEVMRYYHCVSCGRDIPAHLIPKEYPKISETLIDCPWCTGADEQQPQQKEKEHERTISKV